MVMTKPCEKCGQQVSMSSGAMLRHWQDECEAKDNPAKALRFGDVVIVKGALTRRYDHRNRTHIKEWWRSEFRQPRTGILIGFRTLANGTIDLGDYDKPTTFKATEHFKAALVVFNAKTKPVFVHLDDLTNEIIMPQVKA